MDFVLDLSDSPAERIFVVGDILGDHKSLINLLYQQHFGYKDILVATGNFLNPETAESTLGVDNLKCALFLKNVNSAYSVKGQNEVDFLRNISDGQDAPKWLLEHPKKDELIEFMDEMPLIIKISDYIYIVSAGIQPNKSIKDQDADVFYSIGEYDKDSRFYQFENPSKKSWYDFDIYEGDNLLKFCFGGSDLSTIKVPAGYSLGRKREQNLKALIFRNGDEDSVIVVE